ncbi:MAG: nucleotide sugar dehydrogenase [Hyphomicrobiales bacterium]
MADDAHAHSVSRTLIKKLEDRTAVVGVCGLGYVGLPLAMAVAAAGFSVKGYDVNPELVAELARGYSRIGAVPSGVLQAQAAAGRFTATGDSSVLGSCDAILVCVPTPLTRHREPDLTYIEKTTRTIADHLKRGQLIVLESTTYPGTTAGVMKPILEAGGLRSGRDFFLGYSPEREDPGNRDFSTAAIPKVVAGDGAEAQRAVETLYGAVVREIVPVSSIEVAEAVKLTENVFRAVNIALVNELKIVYDAMGIDVWDVIEAAKTKPFGYMPFYPGPGLGGHCIPIDPFYLTWKSREFDVPTRFIELAGEINVSMPAYVVQRLADALDQRFSRGLNGARVLLLGVAYKRNVEDVRESPALKLMELLERKGATVAYHDPHVPVLGRLREYPHLLGRKSVPLDAASLEAADAVLIATDHDAIDYAKVATDAKLVIDTRNAMARKGLAGPTVVKA